jgi:hypothetical protein
MLTLLELRLEGLCQRINQKLPQAPESVLEKVWTILNAANEYAIEDIRTTYAHCGSGDFRKFARTN